MTEEKIAIGLVRTCYGIKGELKVKSLSGEFDHFFKLSGLYLKAKEGRLLRYEIESCRRQNNDLVLKLKGIDNPELAKRLSGSEIWVERQFAAPLEEGDYYHADLYQCDVLLVDKKIGRVRSIVDGHIYELVEVTLDKGGTLLVPFTNAYVGSVDIKNKQVVLTEEAELL